MQIAKCKLKICNLHFAICILQSFGRSNCHPRSPSVEQPDSGGFGHLRLNRIFATHFGHNPASGRVLQKLGMRYEGCQRAHYRKFDQFADSELYGILRSEWPAGEYNG